MVRNSTHTSLDRVLTLEHNTRFSWFPILLDKYGLRYIGFWVLSLLTSKKCEGKEAKYPFNFPADLSIRVMGS